MKFYELDLRQIIPYGIPLNTDSHVEYTSHINDFFLQGFENYFGQLFKVENNELVIDYSRSCSAPNSLFACEFCSDDQLWDAITGAGFKYYTANDHDVNAKFVYDLNNVPFGTDGWLTAVAQYVANSRNIIAKPVYGDKGPYHYGIYLSGDITSSANTSTILSRMIENLGVVGTAHTQVDEFSIEDTSSQIETSAAVGAIDVGILCEVEIPVVAAPDAGASNEIEVVLGLWYSDNAWKNVTFSASNYWVGGITEQTDVEKLSKFGITTTTSETGIGPIGAPVYNGTLFDWSVSSLCDADKKDNGLDVSTFSAGAFSSKYTSVLIRSSVDVAQRSYYWRCHIKLKEGYFHAYVNKEHEEITYQSAMLPITLYDHSGNTIPYDSTKTYKVEAAMSEKDSFSYDAAYYFNKYGGKLGKDAVGNLTLEYLNYWSNKKLTGFIISST